MNKRTIIPLFLILLSGCSSLWAQKINPMAIKIVENGQDIQPDTTLYGGEIKGPAPMEVLFKANVEAPEGYTYYSEWYFAGDPGFETGVLFRTDDEWESVFTDSGARYYRLVVTFVNNENGETTEERSDDFKIVVTESELKVPNAFSPNGDGINDVFKVSHKSLVKFNAYVFNRWGQELYHWGVNNIDEGWDGTAHGKPVKDGVYFIVIEAEGADGVKYKHKGDINILRGFSGTGSAGSASE